MEIRALSDYHVHVRQGTQVEVLVPFTTKQCGRFMVMPNTEPAVLSSDHMAGYRDEIHQYITHGSQVLMTMKLREDTQPETIIQCAEKGCTAVKIYPEGVTSNSSDGISRETIKSLIGLPYSTLQKLFHKNIKTIEDSGMVLCWHGEMPEEEVNKREEAIFPYIHSMLENFPRLRIVFEHVTTARVIERISSLYYRYNGKIAATITPHHMRHTLTDFAGGKLHPHLFCKPLLKDNIDRVALVRAAISGLPCYFLGSDSAPWPRTEKECSDGCAGVWNSPCLLETLADIFDQQNSMDKLEGFTSGHGDRFYGNEPVSRILRLEKDRPWVMPEEIHGMVPYRAGDVINWQVEEMV